MLFASIVGCSVYDANLVTETVTSDAGAAGGGVSAAGATSGDTGGAAGHTAEMAEGGMDEPGAAGGGRGGSANLEAPPYVVGSTPYPPIMVDLSIEGFRDWAHWGLQGADDYNHKQDTKSQLLDFRPWGSRAHLREEGGAVSFEWSDGLPTAQATTTSGISWRGVDQGFTLVTPAADEDRRVNLYIGVRAGTAEILASLSDPDATSRVETHVTGEAVDWNQRALRIDYGLAKVDSELTISVRLIEGQEPSSGVALYAASFSAP